MSIKWIPFRVDREGNGVWENVAWMRTREVETVLPPRHHGTRCIYCKGPLACAPLPKGDGTSIVRCDRCDVWMNYEGSV